MSLTIMPRLAALCRSTGLVLALNARVLSKDDTAFDRFLEKFGNAQTVAWKGSGRTRHPEKTSDSNDSGTISITGDKLERIGFDC
jgi:hypothetical protein